MTQRVWTDAESRAAAADITRHESLYAAAGESAAPRIHEQRIAARQCDAILQPASQRRGGFLIERDDAFFSSLPHHADHATRQIDILEVERDELAEPNAGCIKELEDGTVAPAERRRGIRRVQQLRHLVDGQMRRHLLLA